MAELAETLQMELAERDQQLDDLSAARDALAADAEQVRAAPFATATVPRSSGAVPQL